MTVRVLTGSKHEIAQQVADLPGDVHEAIVFLTDSAGEPASVASTVELMFAEMDSYTVQVGQADYSRNSLYSRMADE